MGGSGSPSESMSLEGPFQSWSSLVGLPMSPGGGGSFQPRSSPVRSPIGGSGSPMRRRGSPSCHGRHRCGRGVGRWGRLRRRRAVRRRPSSRRRRGVVRRRPTSIGRHLTRRHNSTSPLLDELRMTCACAMMYYYLCIICGCQGRGGAAGPKGRLIARHCLLCRDAGAARPCRRSGGRGHRRYSSAYALSSRRCCVHACWCSGRVYILCLLLQFWSAGGGGG
jgi:hypothetical protein